MLLYLSPAPLPLFPTFCDDFTAFAYLATLNTFRLRPPPPDVSPPTAEDVSVLLHNRNLYATRPVRWALAEAHANLGHRNPTDLFYKVNRSGYH